MHNIICPYCSKEIRANNFKRHVDTHSKIEKEVVPTKKRIAWNKGLTKETNSSLLKASNTLKERGCGGWTKEASSKGGKNGGGYREGAGHSKKFHVQDSLGNKVCLQSTYELECSKLLDKLNIHWTRPSSLKYGDRLYFPDFLLIESGIYLDTKNDYLAMIDKQKIDLVVKENEVTVIVLTKDLITENFLRQFE